MGWTWTSSVEESRRSSLVGWTWTSVEESRSSSLVGWTWTFGGRELEEFSGVLDLDFFGGGESEEFSGGLDLDFGGRES